MVEILPISVQSRQQLTGVFHIRPHMATPALQIHAKRSVDMCLVLSVMVVLGKIRRRFKDHIGLPITVRDAYAVIIIDS